MQDEHIIICSYHLTLIFIIYNFLKNIDNTYFKTP
jgi:hypothetical protein